ncbi:YgjV family protein [Anaerosacchariphilus polymeriproducens]|uniref:N-acetyltransferase domain-containing protein n=1 Tax=Anaerosacchariphilus polymeriproducens TaxID=1812858 RepID=A0A371AVZ3_9FIRM|nr:YgjV family protein [Anaerosacchariphilus polymeriproducens]RDU23709.1 hypothetical protein DWV06_07560 [Anaerosacchariphilus polymeriproducens]
MDTQIIEIIGYIGSILVVVSMLMSSVVKLRIVNTVGSGIFAIYALIIQSYPTALMNFCLVAINVYNLSKLLKKTDKHYQLVNSSSNDSLLQHYLDYYKEDIKSYFPQFNKNSDACDVAYIVCCDATPAGLFLGKKAKDGSIEVKMDYAIPTYRDCSVGTYLYRKLSQAGIEKLTYTGFCSEHVSYLNKMGFETRGNDYVKHL